MKRLFILTLIVIFGITTQPFFVLSQVDSGGNTQEIDELNKAIAEKKEKIKQLEQSISEYKKKIESTRGQAVSLSNQIAVIDNYLAQVELDIQATTEKVDTIQLEIEELSLSIEDNETTIARQKKMLAELIRTLHYENGKNYIEVVAAYDNFSDFYNRVHYVKNLETDLGKSAKTVRILTEDLEQKKQESENRQQTYKDLQEELTNKKKDLEEQGQYKATLLAQTHSSELQYKTLVSNLSNQYQQVENEITATEQQIRKKLDSQNAFNRVTDQSSEFDWPTQSRYVTAYFHDKSYPYRNIFEHPAIDIRAAHGTAIHAVASGYIARARRCSTASCYAYVMIAHSNGLSSVYGHLSQILVTEDQFVNRGDIIGYSGATPGTIGAGPFTTGPHLHLEIRKNGIPVNPLDYLVVDY